MNDILKYFNMLVNNYKNSISEDERIINAKNINLFIYNIKEILDYNNYILILILREYKKLKDDILINSTNESIVIPSISDDLLNNINNDLDFIKDISKYIKITNKKQKVKKESNDVKLLESYISSSKDFNKFYKNLNIDIINNFKLDGSSVINLLDKKVILLNTDNILARLHELIHIYTNSYLKYSETYSRLGELGLLTYYNLSDISNSIKDILDLKKIKYIRNQYDYYIYIYGIASLISITYISMYGNNFNDIVKVINNIMKDEYISLEKLFNSLNVTKKNIIDSTNNIRKILK